LQRGRHGALGGSRIWPNDPAIYSWNATTSQERRRVRRDLLDETYASIFHAGVASIVAC
jgi:hypothetical protein